MVSTSGMLIRVCFMNSVPTVPENEDKNQLKILIFRFSTLHKKTSPDIKHITFIGAETVEKKVTQAAAVNLTPTVLELGGKDPAIILPNTDLEKYASIWMRGVFQANG
ncbi:Meiotic Sister-Chromatid recombination aldehyde dehydrogenase [Tulasnella sp. 417]|nr:Meiotic Sister-Chromatid recombination aldehyde dehydrogenase [Tulasnella sp. 417]